MKKCPSLIAFLLVASLSSALNAQEAPPVWPMPSPLPTVPKGVNPSAYPMPRIEWFSRVELNNQNAHRQANEIQLVFDGDSITDLFPSRGKAIWKERYEKLGVFDFGISADRTEHLLWRLSQGQVDGLHPKLIAVMIGTNNTGNCADEQIADGVRAIVNDYRKRCPQAVILLQAIFPRGEKPTDPIRAKIKSINQLIAKLGDGQKVIFTDFGDKFLNPDGVLDKEIMPDFLHPSPKGYQIWADAIQPFIDKYCPAKDAAHVSF